MKYTKRGFHFSTIGNFSDALPCICCGLLFNADERVDCVDVFDFEESYCFDCYEAKLEIKKICDHKKAELVRLGFVASPKSIMGIYDSLPKTV